MLRFPDILLFVAIASCVKIGDLPKIDPPFNLRIDKISTGNHRKAVVHWNYAAPDDIPLRQVEFVLQLDVEKQATQVFRTRFNSGYALQYTLANLQPATNYTVRLTATSHGWENSEKVVEWFFTLPSEWPTPVIVNVTSTVRANYDEFKLYWKMRELPGLVARFEVRVCDSHCFVYLRDSTTNHARVPADFNSEVNITVAALFDDYETGLIERESKPYRGKSQAGEPGKILEIHGETVGNKVALDWHPPFHPMGPLSYYEVFVCDTSKEVSSFRSFNGTGPEEETHALPLTGNAYDMRLNDNDFERMTPSSNTSFSPNVIRYMPPSPMLLVVVKRAPGCARFRMIFLKPDTDSSFENPEVTDENRLFLGSYIGENFNLSPYEIMHLKIRSCLTYASDRFSHDLCGNFAEFEIRSNVATPGLVRNARMELVGDVGELTWRIPKEKRGPIDGFKIYMESQIPGYEDISIKTVNSSVRKVPIPNYKSYTTRVFKVAAFNLDLEDRTLEHVGKWYTVKPPGRRFDGILAVISMVSLLVLIAVGFLYCMV